MVTSTALDKTGLLSEWSWANAGVSACAALLPFVRSANLRANMPIFALLVAMDRWDKYKVMQRLSAEGVGVDSAKAAAEPEAERS